MLGKDSAEGIATELVGAGLVDGRDIVVIAANLQKLITSNGQMRQVTFPLVSFFFLLRVSWLRIFISGQPGQFFVLKSPIGSLGW